MAESGEAPEVLAEAVGVTVDVLDSWVSGADEPTAGEWTKLARHLKRPKSAFLLPRPPSSSLPPDLRTAAGWGSRELGPDERLQLRRAGRLQRYLAQLIAEEGGGTALLPTAGLGDEPDDVARVLRSWLQVSNSEQRGWSSPSVGFTAWRSALERRGVLVLTLRLGADGVRGFSLTHDVAPMIAVNSAETIEARTFTLMHELAHLASRSQAACGPPLGNYTDGGKHERWCDRVAAAVLLPQGAVLGQLALLGTERDATIEDLQLAREVAKRFRTSLRAAALRLVDLGLAPGSLYGAVEKVARGGDRQKRSGGPPGGRPAAVQRLGELGPRTAQVLLDGLDRNRLTERDARNLLRLDGQELDELRHLTRASASGG
ncbi:ImmA/IrrE family metallo-endopeptidase [Nitriliruptor sp.]|uniref:ImmA/IrrE family metallo-endopeptidase n=1 Tax=Nitriliruptor sp. TaxID=2448056 RepID=UPI00349FFE17